MNLEKWIQDHLAQELHSYAFDTILWMPNWKWSALAVILSSILVIHPLFYFSFKTLRNWLQKKQKKDSFLAFYFEQGSENTLSWIFTSLIMISLCRGLEIPNQVLKPLTFLFQLVILISIIFFFFKAVKALEKLFLKYAAQTESRMDDMLGPFIAKSLKGFVVVLGFLIFLQNLGINVVSILAGLGLGGLALALAAQDTAANIFGSITIFLDQPFRVGDAIKIQDVEGEVESIGFRSTRIRTFYNSLITIPNSVVAKEKIDNMGLRPCRRIRHTFGVTYDTSPVKIEEFCESLRYLAHQIPHCIKDTVTVAFNGYGDSSLNILVNFHVEVPTLQEELALQQKFLLEVLKLSQDHKIDFAFPTRTLHVAPGNATPIG